MESSSSNAIAHLLSASQKLDPVSIHDPPPLPPPPNGAAPVPTTGSRPPRFTRNNGNHRRSGDSGEEDSNEEEDEDEDEYLDDTQQSTDHESPASHRQNQQRIPIPLVHPHHLLHPNPPAHIHHPQEYDQSTQQSQVSTAPNGQSSAGNTQFSQPSQSQTQPTTNPPSASSSYMLDPSVIPGLPPIPPDVLPAHITGPVAHLQLHHTPGQLAPPAVPPSGSPSAGGRRGKRHVNDEEWNRQRKDNHKEVERRRRGNINDGINELARIIPQTGNGEKAKGAILHRAVSYIHQLKDNEARNIEKWTLEKLLMDQAMADLQGQVEELRQRFNEEREARARLENEVGVLRGSGGDGEVGNKRPRVD